MSNFRHSILFRLSIVGVLLGMAIVILLIRVANVQYAHDLQNRMEEVRRSAQDGHRAVLFFHELEKSGRLTREQAQTEAKNLIAALRDGGDNYIWINTYQGVMLSHPNADIIGKNLIDMKESGGSLLFKQFNEIVKNGDGGGYIRYFWPKPASDKPVEKVSWVYGFDPWEWIIGTGVYIDDIDDDYERYLGEMTAFGGTFIMLFVALIVVHGRFLRRNIDRLSDILNRFSQGELFISEKAIHPGNEFSKIWFGILRAKDHLAELERHNIAVKVDAINTQVAHDEKNNVLISKAEDQFVSAWEAVRRAFDEIHAASAALNGQISETHAKVDLVITSAEGDVEKIADAISKFESCRAEMDERFAEFVDALQRQEHAYEIAATATTAADRMREAVDDLGKALNVLKSAGSHVRLIDMVLNEIVMSEDQRSERHDYDTLSAETGMSRALLQMGGRRTIGRYAAVLS